jgi:hypothetical protein
MSNVSISHVFDCTPEALWALVGAPAALSAWHPAIAESTVSDGARVCTLGDGASVRERIERHSDAERSYRYRILESPLPMRDYVSTISVHADEGGARFTWECDFEPHGMPASEVEAMIRGLYEAGVQGVAAQLGG